MAQTIPKIGAVLGRISTEPQQTLDSQVARAKVELEKRGYLVPPERVVKVDWSSLDLFNCPEFQELRGWINRKEIGALGIFDRDRLNAIGLQRLVFLSECRENGVELVICQGPPVLDEPEEQLVELALALGKQRQVLRAQQGSRDALRERATEKVYPPPVIPLTATTGTKDAPGFLPTRSGKSGILSSPASSTGHRLRQSSRNSTGAVFPVPKAKSAGLSRPLFSSLRIP